MTTQGNSVAGGHKEPLPPSNTRVFPSSRQLGEILLQAGLITDAQLHEALRTQRELESYKPVGQILVDRKIITRKQLDLFLDRFHKWPRLGEILVKTKVVTRDQLELALAQQKKTGLRLGETIVELDLATEVAIRQALCTQLNIPFIEVDKIAIDQNLTRLINKSYAKGHLVIPLAKIGDILTLAMEDPTDIAVIEELQAVTGLQINVTTSTRAAFERGFARFYEKEPSGEQLRADRPELSPVDEPEGLEKIGYVDEEHQRSADEIVRKLISIALDHHASDIHLDMQDRHMDTRLRIDGVLQVLDLGPLEAAIKKNSTSIISRIKILGQLDITERQRPQDGSFRLRVEKKGQSINVDLRISIVPGYYGENVVLRVLDQRNAPQSVLQIGFSKAITEKLVGLMQRPAGIILITGPRGSGKSTTLLGALMTVYRPDIKILTVEDPIEYVYGSFVQCEVNEKIGNTYARYLRSFLRHDPEVIMLGEIRDRESAQLAFEAAQAGHLVFSALHTNDAVSSVARLMELEVDPGLITSSLLGVLAQRLVRKTCLACREDYTPSGELLKEFFNSPPSDLKWYKGRGCSQCNFTGYRGRIPMGELWIPDVDDSLLMNKGAPFDEIRTSAYQHTILMAKDIGEKLQQGLTNLEEMIRTLPYYSIYQFRQLWSPPEG